MAATPSQTNPAQPTIIVQTAGPSSLRKWFTRLLLLALAGSIITNFVFYARYQDYFADAKSPKERFHSGNRDAEAKIALLELTGTVSPPFTGRLIRSIKRAREDEDVKGAILVIDSPGGFVADSHQIYHELKKLSKEKPLVVVMKRMAASGGYYIAMGAGPDATIYAEPSTWTGSIGVIIPRYNASKLAVEHLGVTSEPLKTGRFKDSLSPFRDLRDDEVELWTAIMNDSFNRFLDVIAENRKPLRRADVRLLGWSSSAAAVLQKKLAQPPEKTVEHFATGQIFTANQALRAGLIDKIGYLDDAIDELKGRIKTDSVRVVRYRHPETLLGMLAGMAEANQPERQWTMVRNLTVPQPMYYCSSLPLLPAPEPRFEE